MVFWFRATFVGCLLGLLLALSPATAADALRTQELFGKIGPYPIGMQITTRDGSEIVAAHYFYLSQLKDIPLEGQAEPGGMTLRGTDGGAFSLQYTARDGDRGPLDREHALGMSGVWKQGGRSLPVTLKFDWQEDGGPERRYESVTNLGDAAYEAKVAGFRTAVLAGDRASAAAFVSYPLHVNGPGRRRRAIHNRAELLSQWESVFTPAVVKALKAGSPHDMFLRSGEATLGGGLGEIWFNENGASAINVP